MHFDELRVVCAVFLVYICACTAHAGPGTVKPSIGPKISKQQVIVNATKLTVTDDDLCGVSVTSIKRGQFIQPAEKGIFPWIARLGYKSAPSNTTAWKCGGTLVSPRHVLTSAACVNSDLLTVRLGQQYAKGAIDISIEKTTIHPNYNAKTNQSNLALVELSRKVDLSKQIHPVCLPTAITAIPITTDFSAPKHVVASWGRIRNKERMASAELHAPQNLIIPSEVCQEKYSQIDKTKYKGLIDNTLMCAVVSGFDQDACLVDVGGPMLSLRLDPDGVYRFHLIGVVWNDIGCGNVFMPRIYTQVQVYSEWIESHVKLVK